MNFCVENIGTTISSSQVECDGHEAKNLLQEDPSTSGLKKGFQPSFASARGFLADYFVRTPITLSIRFPMCIEISHIIINPKFGGQTSSAFSIETLTSYKVWTRGAVTDTPVSKFGVAKEYINSNVIPREIIFRNPRYLPRPPFSRLSTSKGPSSTSSSNDQIVFNLKHPSLNACERVVGLDVTILRSVGSSVPGLGGIQVWGQPCQRCAPEIVNKMLVTWLRRNRRPSINIHMTAASSPTNFRKSCSPDEEKKALKSPCRSKSSSTDDCDDDSLESGIRSTAKRRKLQVLGSKSGGSSVSIPDEFLDAITFEIMVQPIRLPCGMAVDSSTLQKFYKEEAVWGRSPSDPFTGQPFTEIVKPVVDTTLKIRIDKFLTLHSTATNLQSVGRTVGTGKAGFSCVDTTFSSGVKKKRKVNTRNDSLYPPNFNVIPLPRNKPKSATITSPYQIPPEAEPDSINKEQRPTNNNNNNTATTTTTTTSTSTTNSSTNCNNIPISKTKIDQTLEDQLQTELSKVLGESHSSYFINKSSSISSFLWDKDVVKSKSSFRKCININCSKKYYPDGDNESAAASSSTIDKVKPDIFYTTTKMSLCTHILICRPCLLALDKTIPHICHCGSEWDIKDLHRIHR